MWQDSNVIDILFEKLSKYTTIERFMKLAKVLYWLYTQQAIALSFIDGTLPYDLGIVCNICNVCIDSAF